jgi:phage tail-like protein
MAQTSDRNDPYRGFNYRVEIDGTTLAAFSEVSGLAGDGHAVEYREGNERVNTSRKLVGQRTYPNITMKRGYTKDLQLWTWYLGIAAGDDLRRDGAIVLQDEAHNDVLRFEFVNGWVNKIEGAHMNAAGNEVAMESAELCHEGLTIKLAK